MDPFRFVIYYKNSIEGHGSFLSWGEKIAGINTSFKLYYIWFPAGPDAGAARVEGNDQDCLMNHD
jgi:hypothetical protein